MCTDAKLLIIFPETYMVPITLKVDNEKRENKLNLLYYYLQLLIRPKQNCKLHYTVIVVVEFYDAL